LKKVKELQESLKESTDQLKAQLEQHMPPFCEGSKHDDVTLPDTGFPDLIVVNAILQHVSKTPPSQKNQVY